MTSSIGPIHQDRKPILGQQNISHGECHGLVTAGRPTQIQFAVVLDTPANIGSRGLNDDLLTQDFDPGFYTSLNAINSIRTKFLGELFCPLLGVLGNLTSPPPQFTGE